MREKIIEILLKHVRSHYSLQDGGIPDFHFIRSMDISEIADEIMKDEPQEGQQEETIPTAFEWHNHDTGHCYVDYVPHNLQDENNGYTKTPLYQIIKLNINDPVFNQPIDDNKTVIIPPVVPLVVPPKSVSKPLQLF